MSDMSEGMESTSVGGLKTPDGEDQHATAEREARIFGWRPAEEFDGPPERWKPAEEFLEEGKRINGFLRKDLDKLRAELSKRDASIEELKATMQEFAAFHQETEKKAFERAVKELREERKEALREGDGSKVVEIEERIEELESAAPLAKPAAKTPTSPTADPVWIAWVARNHWFTESPKLRAISNSYGDLVRQEFPSLVGEPFLEEVKRRVVEDFPESFAPEERLRASPVGGGGESRGAPRGGAKGYASLPAEVKLQCDKFIKQGLVKSREAYAKDYYGE